MKHTAILIAVMAAAMPSLHASAQSKTDKEPIVTVIVGDKEYPEEVEVEFVNNAPKQQNDNGLPRFAIIGKENKFYLGIGAQFLGEVMYDFGDEMTSNYDFIPSSISPKAPGNGSNFRFSTLTSSFYINAVALPGTDNRVGLFFKAQINDGGNGYGFHLSHFYVTYRGLQAGYSHSLFTDGAAMPYTIDDQGPNGTAALKAFSLSYTHNFTKNFSGAVGVEEPKGGFIAGEYTKMVNQRAPSVPLYLQYAWGSDFSSHVRVSGIVRPLTYRDLMAGKNRTKAGWGIQLSGLANVVRPLTLYWGATYGHGIAEFLQDDTGLDLDGMPSLTSKGKTELSRSLGLTAGLTYNITRRLALNAVYSHLTNWKADYTTVPGDTYRYGDYVAANMIYTFNKIIAAGIEYDYGHRKSFSGNSRETSRVQAQLSISF